MDHDEFEAIVRDALSRLPDWVHEAMQNVDVLVEDEADETFDENPAELLGLYVGTPLTERESDNAGELPDVIYIFRKPHLAQGLPPAELQAEIRKTLIHEVAHYFGIDDDHLDEIGWG